MSTLEFLIDDIAARFVLDVLQNPRDPFMLQDKARRALHQILELARFEPDASGLLEYPESVAWIRDLIAKTPRGEFQAEKNYIAERIRERIQASVLAERQR